jgi:hypothetical protein
MGRLLDSLVALIEAGIERIADPERERLLQQSLLRADSQLCDAHETIGDLGDRLDRVLRELGSALGVEGEPDEVLFSTAWEVRGKLLKIDELEAEVALLKERVYG